MGWLDANEYLMMETAGRDRMDEIRRAAHTARTSDKRDASPPSSRLCGLRRTTASYLLPARPSGWVLALALMGLAAGGATILAG